ncbi:hypothetical protein GCM10009554_78520 [Kribbella koreensis]|uniref:MoaF-like domain-containing protein n=2 Tax=Kribbella TaxID=182639 RepID=A0ABP6XFT4_9ACTN
MSLPASFTPVGKSFRFDLGALRIRYTFDSTDSATFVVENGGGLAPDGHTEQVSIELHEIRPGVFLNSWREATGATVSHLEDFGTGKLYSNITVEGRLHRFVGAIQEA